MSTGKYGREQDPEDGETANESLVCQYCGDHYKNRHDYFVHFLKSCKAAFKYAEELYRCPKIHRYMRRQLLRFRAPTGPDKVTHLLDSLTQEVSKQARVPVARFCDMFRFVLATHEKSIDHHDHENCQLNDWDLNVLAGSLNVSTTDLPAYLLDSPIVLLPLRTGPYSNGVFHASTLIIINNGNGKSRRTELFEFCSCGSETVEATALANSLRQALGDMVGGQVDLSDRLREQWQNDLPVIQLNNMQMQEAKLADACTYMTRWFIHLVLYQIWCLRMTPRASLSAAVEYLQERLGVYSRMLAEDTVPEGIEQEFLSFIGADYFTGLAPRAIEDYNE